jgi:ribose-phosphate pyrophosphokinase
MITPPASVKIFSATNSQYISNDIVRELELPLAKINIQKFSDGEIQPEIQESVRGDYVFVVASTNMPAENLMELLLVIDAAKRASAKYITAVIPYFGFARQDRKDRPRVSLGAKLVANLIVASGANRIMTMDLHAPQIQGFFDIPMDHLDSSYVFIPYLKALGIDDNICFASPDVGSTNRSRGFAKHFNGEMVICDKQRKRANEVAAMTVIGDVTGKDIVLVDDIIDTAGTLTSAAKLLMEKGAKSVRAVCTHPVLSGQAIERVENSVLTELVVCDTIPYTRKSDKIKRLEVAPLFATAIRNAVENKSINSLFIR